MPTQLSLQSIVSLNAFFSIIIRRRSQPENLMTINFVVSCMTTAEISSFQQLDVISVAIRLHFSFQMLSSCLTYQLLTGTFTKSLEKVYIWNKLHYKLQIELVSGFRSMVGHKVIKVNSFTFCWSFLSKEQTMKYDHRRQTITNTLELEKNHINVS